MPYPIAYVQAKCPLNIHATFSLSLAIDKCHTWAAGISVCQHRSTLLPDGNESSISDFGGCNCCYQPFTATVIPRVFWWKTVTTHFSNKPALHPFFLTRTRFFFVINHTKFISSTCSAASFACSLVTELLTTLSENAKFPYATNKRSHLLCMPVYC